MEKLIKIVSHCKKSVEISINDHRNYYESVEEHLQEVKQDIDPNILKKMIEKDTIVVIQAYPETSIGFFKVYHYDIEKACDIMLSNLEF